MRYINQGTVPAYVSTVSKSVLPAARTQELPLLRETIEKVLRPTGSRPKSKTVWSVPSASVGLLLSDEDMAAVKALLAADSKARGTDMSKAVKASKTVDDTAYRHMDKAHEAFTEAVKEIVKESGEREARINSESNFIMPDGTPVPKSEVMAKASGPIVPEMVDAPASADDIARNNAAVSLARDKWPDTPRTGKDAVENRHPVPGTPNFPSLSESEYGDVKRPDASSASLHGFGHGFFPGGRR